MLQKRLTTTILPDTHPGIHLKGLNVIPLDQGINCVIGYTEQLRQLLN